VLAAAPASATTAATKANFKPIEILFTFLLLLCHLRVMYRARSLSRLGTIID
jgi:hypothetical protein